MSLLERILSAKQKEIEALLPEEALIKQDCPAENYSLKFEEALEPREGETLRVIAECKKASPSRGLICKNYDPEKIASLYRSCGAAAISVLTESTLFQGDCKHLAQAGKCGLPVLRKDFILSPLQLYQAKRGGAHAVLLIVRLLSPENLKSLYELAYEIGLGVLVEVHNEDEMELALELPAKVIGINHRDLESLEMDMDLSARLSPQIRKKNPGAIIVAESGLEEKKTLQKIQTYVDAVLIGTALMESEDIPKRYKEIFG